MWIDALRRQGYPADDSWQHLVMAAQALSDPEATAGRLVIAARPIAIRTLTADHETLSLILCALPLAVTEGDIRGWIQTLLVKDHTQGSHWGVSSRVMSLSALPQAIDHAVKAWQMGAELGHPNRAYYYEEMPLYRLFSELAASQQLERFYRDTLGALERYDQSYGSDLLSTLETFFYHNANSLQAARALGIHRNTMSYRLQRIADIIQRDLSSPENRLALQLALKIQRLVI